MSLTGRWADTHDKLSKITFRKKEPTQKPPPSPSYPAPSKPRRRSLGASSQPAAGAIFTEQAPRGGLRKRQPGPPPVFGTVYLGFGDPAPALAQPSVAAMCGAAYRVGGARRATLPTLPAFRNAAVEDEPFHDYPSDDASSGDTPSEGSLFDDTPSDDTLSDDAPSDDTPSSGTPSENSDPRIPCRMPKSGTSSWRKPKPCDMLIRPTPTAIDAHIKACHRDLKGRCKWWGKCTGSRAGNPTKKRVKHLGAHVKRMHVPKSPRRVKLAAMRARDQRMN
ncbi:hypothetical protein OF83DRAFT_1149603 [Amylostereum chailletii]|nr:hypothetical protein OF83DRAFT_1149603 [Amylostereum chailletii]